MKFLRSIPAMPFSALGWLIGPFLPDISGRLFSIAWTISANPLHAIQAIGSDVKRNGTQAALPQARAMFDRHPSPSLGAYIGTCELHVGDRAAAREYLEKASALPGEDLTGLTEYLQLSLVDSEEEKLELAKQLESRKDLAPISRRMVLGVLMIDDLNTGNVATAVERAKLMHAVRDEPAPMLILWGWYLSRGDRAKAAALESAVICDDIYWLMTFKLFVAEKFGLDIVEPLKRQLDEFCRQAQQQEEAAHE